jgi:hypothetical protein
LQDLQHTQDEAASIVERLDLDPPLVPRDRARARPGRWFNPRVMGLAASVLLVAGTAWLLRGSYGARLDGNAGTAADAVIAQRDTGSSIAESVDTAVPGAARVAEDGLAEAPVLAASRETATRKRNAAPAPAAQPVPSKALAGVRPSAKEAAAPGANLADAEARLGAPVVTIEGLSPAAVEYLDATPDSAAGVRLVYEVRGTQVTLSQRRMRPAAPAASPSADAAVAAVSRDEVTTKQLARMEHEGRVDAATAAPGVPAVRRWEVNGALVTLEGMLPPDSLAALARRVH